MTTVDHCIVIEVDGCYGGVASSSFMDLTENHSPRSNRNSQLHDLGIEEGLDDNHPVNDYTDRLDRLQNVHAQSSAETSGLGDSLQRMHTLSSTETNPLCGISTGPGSAGGGGTTAVRWSPSRNDIIPDVPIRHGRVCTGRPDEPLRQRSFEDDMRLKSDNLCSVATGFRPRRTEPSAHDYGNGLGRTKYQSRSTHTLRCSSYNTNVPSNYCQRQSILPCTRNTADHHGRHGLDYHHNKGIVHFE